MPRLRGFDSEAVLILLLYVLFHQSEGAKGVKSVSFVVEVIAGRVNAFDLLQN